MPRYDPFSDKVIDTLNTHTDHIEDLWDYVLGLAAAHHVTRQAAEVKLNDIVETATETLEAHQKVSARDPFDVVIEALERRCREAYDQGHDQSGRLASSAIAQVRAARRENR